MLTVTLRKAKKAPSLCKARKSISILQTCTLPHQKPVCFLTAVNISSSSVIPPQSGPPVALKDAIVRQLVPFVALRARHPILYSETAYLGPMPFTVFFSEDEKGCLLEPCCVSATRLSENHDILYDADVLGQVLLKQSDPCSECGHRGKSVDCKRHQRGINLPGGAQLPHLELPKLHCIDRTPLFHTMQPLHYEDTVSSMQVNFILFLGMFTI